MRRTRRRTLPTTGSTGKFVLLTWAFLGCLVAGPPGQTLRTTQQADPASAHPKQPGPLDRAQELITGGQLDQAIELLRQFRQQHPRESRAYFLSGLALSQKQDWVAAADELKEALRLEAANAEYSILYANVLTRLDQNELATAVLKIFAEDQALQPLTTAWAWLLSDTFFRAGANDDALRVLDLLSDQNPEDPRTDLNRGQIYYVKGEHQKALEYIRRSISRQPEQNPVAYFELGRTLEQVGDSVGAREAYLEALHQDPENPEYLWKLGASCLALGDAAEAIRYLERALPSAEAFPEIYYVLGRAYQARNDRPKAVEALKKFQSASANDRRREYERIEAGKLVGRGEAALDRREFQEARLLFQQALEKDPNSWAAHGYLAEIALGTGDAYGAGPHVEKMLELDPDHPVALYLAARYWYDRNDMRRARQYAEQVRPLRPGNADLRNLLGNIYLALDRVDEAAAEYQAALELEPERQDFQLNLSAARKRLP